MDIVNMSPGREKDCQIALKIMGWDEASFDCENQQWNGYPNKNPRRWIVPVPEYSTDISAAFEVVEKIRKDLNGWIGLQLFSDIPFAPPGTWLACFGGGRQNTAFATTAPDAICKAALKLMGVKVGEEMEG